MQVEINQLELRYAGLRIVERGHRAKLLASVAEQGQHSPVTVVAAEEPERFVLIDGYARVAVLRDLARDVVDAVTLELSEAEALVMSLGLGGQRRRSALEDGWLLHVLMERHGLSLTELSTRLGRSPSWVSRRLALVTVLPDEVQKRVRRGQLSAQVATKYLVPLARANGGQCTTLVSNLRGHRPSVREMQRLYTAWRVADAEQRRKIVERPKLFLKATDPEEPMGEAAKQLVEDLRVLAAVSRRAERRVDDGADRDAADSERRRIRRAFTNARQSFESLGAAMHPRENTDAGPRHAQGDPPAAG
jgi:ParB/RepB/Spo0J family partition protein